MHSLRDRFGWRIVQTYTTRPARENDDKVSVSPEVFARMALDERMFTVKHLFGEMYGEDRRSILDAISARSSDRWCLDLAVGEIAKYSAYNTLKFILLPESLDQLVAQLEAAGRKERVEGAKADLEKYTQLSNSVQGENGYVTIFNRHTRLNDSLELIRKISSSFFNPTVEA
ncbi:Guanylate kinase [Tropicimonas isoalkanivorans]|uniref:Guanylate kinase n=2 Tax=Tropicimonas isoalkanivorans TaxID=441112 RepID=A0A1I1JCH1_9RHOB|nr:Guanylate kinase [Tropicimonas isoalkanivorans]